jgi:hypothetical protein
MYATIRRYTPSNPSTLKTDIDGLKRRIEQKFLPMLQDVTGFHCYYAVNVGDRELTTISIFEDRKGAQDSNRRAAEFVRTDPLRDMLADPEVIEGELLISREAEVRAH